MSDEAEAKEPGPGRPDEPPAPPSPEVMLRIAINALRHAPSAVPGQVQVLAANALDQIVAILFPPDAA